MKITVTKNYEEMSAKAAEIIAGVIVGKPDCVLGLATGSTPIGVYDELVKKYEDGALDFSAVCTVNLDEYYPISPDNPQSYRYFMNEHLFDRVNIDKRNTFIPDGTARDVEGCCKAYEELIDRLGGADVQILGIGRNGHIGFNEPDRELPEYTHLVSLTPDTIAANSRFFDSVDDVPKHALTMGIHSVFKSKKIILLASGKDKAKAIDALVNGNITTDCPASLLCLHPDVTVICDRDAYSSAERNK